MMKNDLVNQITKSRTAFLEVLVAAILLAVCASLVASIIFSELEKSVALLLLGTSVVIIGCVSVLAKKLGNARSSSLEINAFLNINPKENTLIDIPRYEFGEDLVRYFEGAFKENPALKTQWDKEPIGSGLNIDMKKNTATKKVTASAKLVSEATEYYILDKLSTHLTDYFNKQNLAKDGLKEYSREDVPDILLSNRFMELFTKSMENRASFDAGQSSKRDGIVVMAFGNDGAIYHRFDLTLPANTKVSRNESGAIKIDTENFTLTIQVDFGEYGFVTPRGFEEYFLGIDDFESSSEYALDVKINVEFKILSLLRNSKWDYHSWLDGFLNTLDGEMSADAYFHSINWNLAHTIIQCGEISQRPNKNVN